MDEQQWTDEDTKPQPARHRYPERWQAMRQFVNKVLRNYSDKINGYVWLVLWENCEVVNGVNQTRRGVRQTMVAKLVGRCERTTRDAIHRLIEDRMIEIVPNTRPRKYRVYGTPRKNEAAIASAGLERQ